MVGRGRDELDKAGWRARVLAERRASSQESRSAEAAALAEAVGRWADGRTGTACAYVPVGSEPGSLAMVDALRRAGWRVLLPVVPVPVTKPEALEWAEYVGELTAGAFGLLEPTGPRLGPEAVGEAEVLFVPALAVDSRGVRLGRGGGYYDRSLPLARPGALLVAVVRDSEFVDELPAEPHDVRVGAVLTPTRGLVLISSSG
ncbi:5-formyltetrahydrofolate cyclo-ligase [Streptoalloteichus tenebrarius]|uniref:5-formyltetrahydrofolate cyclo-ligase n=1 Tax=Streptoalloteichus tenebrarius (strain ATCC 17920 / DSM 40477 / JCM 4838 / CBS 697.72 / NBRC 16177 / NCIMB 11028 / NRRL B-12390 / A12253. 1 / ISP 5477) TaxID=1933 RepID=A0ABT1I2E4_STRSD|nr:5-formyltetrahydrofolate cyclo-ligase [Streptoalloteichus tenebrarius]MCP2261947.1 5-formyltetrahydrofolate cyclo-ligase [Streptoalloteichus tenebrarius]